MAEDLDPARGHGPAEHAAEELFRARAARCFWPPEIWEG